MFTADLFERVVRTFIGTFVVTFSASFAAPASVTDWSAWKAAGVAAVLAAGTSAFSAVLAVITKQLGPSKDTASMVSAPPTTAGPSAAYGPTVTEPIVDHAA